MLFHFYFWIGRVSTLCLWLILLLALTLFLWKGHPAGLWRLLDWLGYAYLFCAGWIGLAYFYETISILSSVNENAKWAFIHYRVAGEVSWAYYGSWLLYVLAPHLFWFQAFKKRLGLVMALCLINLISIYAVPVLTELHKRI